MPATMNNTMAAVSWNGRLEKMTPTPIRQQAKRANKTQPPKGVRNHHSLLFLSRPPLHKKAGKEDRVAQPSYEFPEVPLDSKKHGGIKELRQQMHGGFKRLSTG